MKLSGMWDSKRTSLAKLHVSEMILSFFQNEKKSVFRVKTEGGGMFGNS